MTRPLFEQYKDALRRGHLAARALKVDEALVAYAEAAKLAPDRAAPHSSSATVLHRAGRDTEALAAFERALAIAADDEATLRARAGVFRDMGRLASAAADLERLAEALDADGRRDEALVAAREAVTLTANAARRALVARLEAPEDESAPRTRPTPVERAAAIARPAPPTPKANPAPPAPTDPAAVAPATAAPVPVAPDEAVEDPFAARLAAIPDAIDLEPEMPPTSAPEAPKSSSTLLDLYDAPIDATSTAQAPPHRAAPRPESGPAQHDGVEPSAEDALEPAAAASPAPPAPKAPIGFTGHLDVPAAADEWTVPARRSSFDLTPGLQSDALVQLEEDDASAAIPWPAIDLPSAPPPPIVGPPPDPELLMAEAHALIDAGNPKDARNLMLTAVMVHRAAGRPDAALDVCLQLLALAPGDAHVHLAIAGLQLDRGWRTLATDKIGLLLRLTALTGDTQAEADAHALAAERLRDETPASFARV